MQSIYFHQLADEVKRRLLLESVRRLSLRERHGEEGIQNERVAVFHRGKTHSTKGHGRL